MILYFFFLIALSIRYSYVFLKKSVIIKIEYLPGFVYVLACSCHPMPSIGGKQQESCIAATLLFVVPAGIEPGTQGFSVLCSTNGAMAPCYFADAKVVIIFVSAKCFNFCL